MARCRIGEVDDLAAGELARVEADGVLLCVAHVPGEGLFALADRCPHEDVPLSDGDLDGAEIECPAHGSRFDVRTGAVRGLPATVPAQTFKVEVDGDTVFVVL